MAIFFDSFPLIFRKCAEKSVYKLNGNYFCSFLDRDWKQLNHSQLCGLLCCLEHLGLWKEGGAVHVSVHVFVCVCVRRGIREGLREEGKVRERQREGGRVGGRGTWRIYPIQCQVGKDISSSH